MSRKSDNPIGHTVAKWTTVAIIINNNQKQKLYEKMQIKITHDSNFWFHSVFMQIIT